MVSDQGKRMTSEKESKVIAKYIADYAEPETSLVTCSKYGPQFDFALILPCYDEDFAKVKNILCHKASGRVLVIVVVNAPINAAPVALQATQQLYQALSSFPPAKSDLLLVIEEHGRDLSMIGSLSLHTVPNSRNTVLLVDRVSVARIPPKQGVGLARKIGADLALKLFYQGALLSGWLGSTDADAKLPADYFEILKLLYRDSQSHAGAVFGFRHICVDKPLHLAATLYDLSLRYYIDALAWCGSPYAFATIGSCLAFNLVAYAQVRGFPKRAGGEDFYLLNKLCKLKLAPGLVPTGSSQASQKSFVASGILSLDQCVIALEARESHRVPFGTGPAITKILATNDPINGYLFYHPRIFVLLHAWIEAIHCVWRLLAKAADDSLEAIWWQCLDEVASNTSDTLPTNNQLQTLSVDELNVLKSWCDESGWFEALGHCRRQASHHGAFVVQLHTWFDGFRTLKFVHYIRQNLYSSLPANVLLTGSANLPDVFCRQVLAQFGKRLYDSSEQD